MVVIIIVKASLSLVFLNYGTGIFLFHVARLFFMYLQAKRRLLFAKSLSSSFFSPLVVFRKRLVSSRLAERRTTTSSARCENGRPRKGRRVTSWRTTVTATVLTWGLICRRYCTYCTVLCCTCVMFVVSMSFFVIVMIPELSLL